MSFAHLHHRSEFVDAESEAEYERDSCVHIDPPPEGGCLFCGAGVPGLLRTSEYITRKALLVQRTESLRRWLRQDVRWMTAGRRIIKIDSMSKQHSHNLILWLGARGPILHEAECATFLFLPEPSGEHAYDSFVSDQNILFGMEWDEWLARQPLVAALVKRLRS